MHLTLIISKSWSTKLTLALTQCCNHEYHVIMIIHKLYGDIKCWAYTPVFTLYPPYLMFSESNTLLICCKYPWREISSIRLHCQNCQLIYSTGRGLVKISADYPVSSYLLFIVCYIPESHVLTAATDFIFMASCN